MMIVVEVATTTMVVRMIHSSIYHLFLLLKINSNKRAIKDVDRKWWQLYRSWFIVNGTIKAQHHNRSNLKRTFIDTSAHTHNYYFHTNWRVGRSCRTKYRLNLDDSISFTLLSADELNKNTLVSMHIAYAQNRHIPSWIHYVYNIFNLNTNLSRRQHVLANVSVGCQKYFGCSLKVQIFPIWWEKKASEIIMFCIGDDFANSMAHRHRQRLRIQWFYSICMIFGWDKQLKS